MAEQKEIPSDWYLTIEEPIREIVRVLRNNGINTTCSCGHEMYIEADIIPDGELYDAHRLIGDFLAENKMPIDYSISVQLEVKHGHFIHCFAYIKIGGDGG